MCNSPTDIANAVRDADSGDIMEFRQLLRHHNPKNQKTWTTSTADEFGRLFQGVGKGDQTGQRVQGTNTFHFIHRNQVPHHKIKDVTCARFVCTLQEMKENKHRTRMTAGGNKISYQGDAGTPIAHLETAKLLLNSVLSRPGARFMTLDLANFYLMTPMTELENTRMKLSDIPNEIIEEHQLHQHEHHGWACVEIRRGAYGLPQAGKLSHKQLSHHLNAAGHYEAATTSGLWRHKWRPIAFALVVDDFGVEPVGKLHADHLIQTLKAHYDVTQDWSGVNFLSIDLEWDYAKGTVRLSMKNYILKVLKRFNHLSSNKACHSPHPHQQPTYGVKKQCDPDLDNSQQLSTTDQTRLQAITGALSGYARAVDNELLVALGLIAMKTHAPTTLTDVIMTHLLNYVHTYPNDGITLTLTLTLTHRKSGMQLAAHSDAVCLNENQAKSRASAHMHVSKNVPIPSFNGAVMTNAKFMKNVMSSAAEAELASLLITAKKCVELRQTLQEMGWPQLPTPMQVDNTTTVGVVTNTIIPEQTKSVDMRLWWLQFRTNQKQFRPYWASGKENLADNASKHHPNQHHLSQRPPRAGLQNAFEPQ